MIILSIINILQGCITGESYDCPGANEVILKHIGKTNSPVVNTRISLGINPANERHCYNVKTSVIGWLLCPTNESNEVSHWLGTYLVWSLWTWQSFNHVHNWLFLMPTCITKMDMWFSYNPTKTLQWRHNGHNGVSNHQPLDCLLNCVFGRRSKKTPKLHVTGLWAGNSPVPDEFPAQKASNTENVSIWRRHHVTGIHTAPPAVAFC